MARKKVKKRASPQNGHPAKLPGIARPDWAWFTVHVGGDHPHRKRKGRGSYTRKEKHSGTEPTGGSV